MRLIILKETTHLWLWFQIYILFRFTVQNYIDKCLINATGLCHYVSGVCNIKDLTTLYLFQLPNSRSGLRFTLETELVPIHVEFSGLQQLISLTYKLKSRTHISTMHSYFDRFEGLYYLVLHTICA